MTRAISFLLAVLLPCTAWGFHYVTPQLLQITPVETAGTIGATHWAGLRYVVFDTDADLLGTGSVGRQVFLFDLQERDLHGGPALYQLTNGAGDSRHATAGKNGRQVVYDAQPDGGGPRQLFLFDRRSGARYQLTQGAADSVNARMDDAGRTAVFESSANFFGTAATGPQIYAIDLRSLNLSCPYPCPAGNSGLRQITDKSGVNANPVTSNGGKVIAFESDADLLNAGENETQVYLFDGRTGTTTILSHGPGASRNPSISRNGGQVAFESQADLAGHNSGGTQIYLYTRATGMSQITLVPNGNSSQPSLSINGHALAFVSTDDLLDNGSSGSQAFSYDLRKNVLTQITRAAGSVTQPAYSSGVFATFISDGNLLANSTTGPALYLVNMFALGGTSIP